MSATNIRHQATRPHPNPNQVGKPSPAQPCRCEEPFGDVRDATCCRCGHQVNGKPIPVKLEPSLGVGVDHSTFAQKVRKYRPAA